MRQTQGETVKMQDKRPVNTCPSCAVDAACRGPARGATSSASVGRRTRACVALLLCWSAAEVAAAAEAPQAQPAGSFNLVDAVARMVRGANTPAAQAGPESDIDLIRRLWHSRMSLPQPTGPAETDSALEQLIEQVRTVKFTPRNQPPAFAVPTEPPQTVATETPVTSKGGSRPAAAPAARGTEPAGPLSPQLTQAIVPVLKDANRPEQPLEMAELLFLGGHRNEAAVLYRKALELVDIATAAGREDRAWILLQLGNCLRDTDARQARDAYGKLIMEHADSPWLELAKAQRQLLDWHEQARPRELIGPTPARQPTETQP